WTDDALASSAALEEAHHAMEAHVGEAADFAVFPAHDEDRLVVDGEGQIIAGLRDLGSEPGRKPATPKQPLALEREDGGIVIEPRRQGGRLLMRPAREVVQPEEQGLG